ncbi:MAG: diaminopimelate epimerase [Alphaproteobacteria bacterium]
MTPLAFTKMHGLGNDFVVLDGRRAAVQLSSVQAKLLADRHRGIGCDQVIIIEPPQQGGDVFMRILNADGGEVEACGNATRCVAARLMKETGKNRLVIETKAGHVEAVPAGDGLISVDMGSALLNWRDIPVATVCDTLHMPVQKGPLRDPVGTSMGNPHATFFVENADDIPLDTLGPVLECDPFFPARANIGIASLEGKDRIRLRVWERGAGLTQACGSGACAAAVAAARRGLTGRKVVVRTDGGDLSLHWREDGHVIMTGPVAVSFIGLWTEP